MSEVRHVLDASALLAVMLGEPGATTVAERFADCCISAVNLSEVVAKLVERGIPLTDVTESLSELDLDVHAFDATQAIRAGILRGETRSRGLSLGDRACLALAAELNAVAVTTDSAWGDIDLGITIELAR